MQNPGQYSLQINKQGNTRSEPGESAFETNRDPGRITSIISSAQGGIPVFSQNQAVSLCKNLRYFISGNGSGIHHRESSGNPSIQSNPLLQSGTGDAQVVPGASRLTCTRGRHTTPGYPITCRLYWNDFDFVSAGHRVKRKIRTESATRRISPGENMAVIPWPDLPVQPSITQPH